MMSEFLIALGALFVGLLPFFRRACGGAIPLGSTTRAHFFFWALPIGVICTLFANAIGLPWWVGACCGAVAFVMQTMGHSFAQTNKLTAYLCMSLIGFCDCTAILVPFVFYTKSAIFFIIPALFGPLQGLASFLGYSLLVRARTFHAFGVTWCRPVEIGGSEWEELFIAILPFVMLFAILWIKLAAIYS